MESASWEPLSAIGALATTPAGRRRRWFLALRRGSVRTPQVIESLRGLRRHLHGRVILLWDRLSAHRSGATHRHLQAQRHWLHVELFPPYAPELNPVEYLWAHLDGTDMANFVPTRLDDVADQVQRAMRRGRQRPDLGRAFLRHSGLYKR